MTEQNKNLTHSQSSYGSDKDSNQSQWSRFSPKSTNLNLQGTLTNHPVAQGKTNLLMTFK